MVGATIGNYRITQKIGEGSMGAVYAAEHDRIGSKVAIKVLPAEDAADPRIVTRFFNEARAASLVRHPGVVSSLDYGTLPEGAPYIVMEYLAGETLRARLQRQGALGAGALRVCRQIAAALAAAHERGVVHRDLKPENVMIVSDPESPGGERARVLDFGIAKLALEIGGSDMTRPGVLMGTPVYMSPEQCRGARDVGARCDVYALGVMLFEMLTDELPFRAKTLGDMLSLHLYQAPPLLSAYAPAVAPAIEALVAAMLDKDPARRPSMAEVVARLECQGAVPTQALRVPEALAALALAGPEDATLGPPGEGPPAVSAPQREASLRASAPRGEVAPGAAPRAGAQRRRWVSLAAAAPILFGAVVLSAILDRGQGLEARTLRGGADPAAPLASSSPSTARPRTPPTEPESRRAAPGPAEAAPAAAEPTAAATPRRDGHGARGGRPHRSRSQGRAALAAATAPTPAAEALPPAR